MSYIIGSFVAIAVCIHIMVLSSISDLLMGIARSNWAILNELEKLNNNVKRSLK